MNKTYNFGLGGGDNGNVLSITNCGNTSRTQNFTYDPLNRIASAQSSGTQWGETFTIDAWGNLTNESGISGKTYAEGLTAAPASNLNRLNGYGYDAPGNLNLNGATSYFYDDENRLVWTSGYRYIYDGDGNRVAKCAVGSATTACPTSGTTGTLYWRSTSGDTLDESDLAGNPQEEYVFFNGQRIARRDVTSTGATLAVHYYYSDHLGTHAVVSNAAGTSLEQDIDYYPFGGQQYDYSAASVAQHYKFNGKERDTESGLDNFGARFDASNLGRFMTPDWAAKPTTVPYANFGNPQSLNLYSYVQNNPTTLGDPDGHDWESNIVYLSTAAGTLGGALVGGTVGAGAGTLALPGGGTVGGGYAGGAFGAGVGAGFGIALGHAIVNTIKAVSSSGEATPAPASGTTPAPANQPGTAAPTSEPDKGGGKSGEVYVTEPQESGKPYVGRTTQGVDQRMETRTDGRTGKAAAVDSYKNTEEGRYKEQKAIDQRGGVQNLDNKRNEVNQQKMQELKKKYDNQ